MLNIKNISLCALLYLFISVFLFLGSWFVSCISIPIIIGGLITLFLLFRKKSYWCYDDLRSLELRLVDALSLVLLFLLLVLSLYSTGLAGGVDTHPDYRHFRNACYHNLIDAPWPVVLPNGKEFTYYVAGLLPPAMLSRMTESYAIQQWFLLIWSVIPLFLALLLMFCRMRKISWLLILLVLFMRTPFCREYPLEWICRAYHSMCFYVFGVDWQVSAAVGRLSAAAVNMPALLAVSAPVLVLTLLVTTQSARHVMIPFCMAMLAAISPIGAVGIFPVALMYYARAFFSDTCVWRKWVAGLILPLMMSFCWLVYFGRSQSDMYVGFTWNNWTVVSFLAYYLPTQLFLLVLLWPVVKNRWGDKTADILMVLMISILPVLFIGSSSETFSGFNELWFKSSAAYVAVLACRVVQIWEDVPKTIRLGWIGCAGMSLVGMLLSFSAFDTARQPEDIFCGHLNHDDIFLNQSCPPCKEPLVPGVILREGGAAESVFPGIHLPKAPGCSYEVNAK